MRKSNIVIEQVFLSFSIGPPGDSSLDPGRTSLLVPGGTAPLDPGGTALYKKKEKESTEGKLEGSSTLVRERKLEGRFKKRKMQIRTVQKKILTRTVNRRTFEKLE